jgi:hypothetical protein
MSQATRPKDGASRQAEWKARQRAAGRVQKMYWATETEHAALAALLATLRAKAI